MGILRRTPVAQSIIQSVIQPMIRPVTVLLTTFETWLPHQASNASDDLVCLWQSCLSDLASTAIMPSGLESPGLESPQEAVLADSSLAVQILHRLPVEAKAACAEILQGVELYQPDYVLVCGMAESRHCLSLEVRAVGGVAARQTAYWTPISLTKLYGLRKGLRRTGISYDAGRFVCNETYARLLRQYRERARFPRPLFLHVPLLTVENQMELLDDFRQILHFFAASP